MTSDNGKCGLSSLIPMSCRGRAEAFARRLHSRLRSLGSQDESTNETSWLQSHENPVSLSQPRHSSSENDVFFDFTGIDSPESPEELEPSDIDSFINEDNLKLLPNSDCQHANNKEAKNHFFNHVIAANSNDSDSSDGPFFDTENEVGENELIKQNDGTTISRVETDKNYLDDVGTTSSTSQDEFITSSECTLPICDNEDESTLSLNSNKDNDDENCSSLECSASLADIPALTKNDDEIYSSALNINKDLTIICPTNNNNKIELVVSTSNECLKLEASKDFSSKKDDEDDDEVEERIPRVRRCSSLKTGKTPPGTPGRKKIVRFADVLGLDLADVRTFLDEVPKVPVSAYDDLKNVDLNDADNNGTVSTDDQSTNNLQNHSIHGIRVDKVLLPLFQQPGGQPNFLDMVRERQVCLENALVKDPVALSITGTVRVRNLDFNKTVHIRYTLDSWQNFADLQATYVQNSCDGFSDKFSFLLYAHSLLMGQRLEFAVRFQCKGCQYWDNNNGVNYCFQCLPASNSTPYVPITGDEDVWGASFYYQQEDLLESDAETTEELTHTDIKEYITHTLGSKETPKEKNNVLTIFIILIFSVLLMYLQKAIYFTK